MKKDKKKSSKKSTKKKSKKVTKKREGEEGEETPVDKTEEE